VRWSALGRVARTSRARPERVSGGGRLMEAEAHALVVSAEGKPAEAWFFRAGIVRMATELANGDYGSDDVRNREEDVDAAFLILVVEPAADRRSLDPRLVAIARRVKGPLKQLAVEGLRALGIWYADLEEGWFPAHGCSLGRRDAVGPTIWANLSVVVDDCSSTGAPRPPISRSTDWLLDVRDQREKQVFDQVATLLNLEVGLLFFDTTSTYSGLEEPDEPVAGDDRGLRRGDMVSAFDDRRMGKGAVLSIVPARSWCVR
jgi:hypothetical protein